MKSIDIDRKDRLVLQLALGAGIEAETKAIKRLSSLPGKTQELQHSIAQRQSLVKSYDRLRGKLPTMSTGTSPARERRNDKNVH
jgi:hypothetical protein